MNRVEIAGGTFSENLPGGLFHSLIPGRYFRSHEGYILLPRPTPAGPEFDVLYTRMTMVGGFQLVGQAQREHTDPARGTWRWNDAEGWTHVSTEAPGVYPCIFDNAGHVHIAGPAQGSQGFRYVSETGEIVSGDDTLNAQRRIGVQLGLHNIWEFTHRNGITIGQGEAYALIVYQGQRYILEHGGCWNINFNMAGTELAVSMWKRDEGKAVLFWLDVSEIASLPLEGVSPPPPPPPPPPPDPPEDRMNYNTGPLNEYAQARWLELPHGTRHEQAAALFRILYEYRQRTGDPIEVFRKGCTDTTFTGSDGHCYAEDICVINEGANGKWYKDVGVAFGAPSAGLNFGAGWQHPNGNDAANCFPPPPPAGVVEPPDPPDPPPTPPDPPPPNTSELRNRVMALEARCAQIEHEQQEAAALNVQAFANLQQQIELLESLGFDPAEWTFKANVSRTLAHSHTVTVTVERKA